MSANPEVQPIVAVVALPEAVASPLDSPDESDGAPQAPGADAHGYLAYDAAPKAARPAWHVPAAIAGVGVIVAGALGYVLLTTVQQRDSARRQLAVTQATLAS